MNDKLDYLAWQVACDLGDLALLLSEPQRGAILTHREAIRRVLAAAQSAGDRCEVPAVFPDDKIPF